MRNLEKNMPQSQSVAAAFKEKNAHMILDKLHWDKGIADVVVSTKKLLCVECGAELIRTERGLETHLDCPNSTQGKTTCKKDNQSTWVLVVLVIIFLIYIIWKSLK